MRFRSLIILLLALLPATVHAQALPTRLVQATDITYLGHFDLPDVAGNGGRGCFTWQHPGAMGYNPATHSLILTSHDWDSGWGGEVNIPSGFGGTATLRSSCKDITAGRISQIDGGGNGVHIGGFLVRGSDLLISAFPYYTTGTTDGTHMRRSTTWSSNTVTGPVRVGNTSSGIIGGYMAHIPAAWQTALKGDMLTGQCCLSIISRSSYGPSVSSARVDDVLTQTRPAATTLVNYPQSNPLEPYRHGNVQLLWNGTTRIRGVAFPAGTASVLFFGLHGIGTTCYGDVPPCVDPVSTDKGEHGYPYQAQVWAYNAHDLAAVAAGTRAPHSLRPYAVWALPGMGAHVAGAAIDPATNRVYVLETRGAAGDRGRVRVYQVAVTAPPAPVPVDCVGSWSQATRVSESACVSGQRTVTWRRAFTISTPASGGGAQCEAAQGAVSSTTSTETCESSTPQPDPQPDPTPCECTPVPGPAGPQGPRGERGETGPAGRDGTSVTLEQIRALIDQVLATLRIVRE